MSAVPTELTQALAAFRAALPGLDAAGVRRHVEAIALLARGAALEGPALAEAGHLLAQHWRYADADPVLARAAQLDPASAGLASIRSIVRKELGDTDGALAVLQAAGRAHPGDLRIAAADRLMLPQVYASVEDVARWRARFAAGLAELAAAAPRFEPRHAFAMDRGNFLLAYQGEDDCGLQRAYSDLLGDLAGRMRPAWREPRRRTFDGGRRLRIGFVGSLFRDCTAGRYFERWITGLDPRRFERHVFHTAPVTDDVSRRIAAGVEAFVDLRVPQRETAERIDAAGLDVLVHPEVGMDAMSYVLAAVRLAPLQVAGWGHPVTTGSSVMDAFITCDAMEPPDAPSHYVEALWRLPGLGVDYAMPPEPAAARRADFGLPGDKRLYMCPQSLFKIHPEMDAAFAEIAARDPAAALVFFQAGSREVTLQFGRRVQAALAARGLPPGGQLKFLPRVDSLTFRRVLALADVVLDTWRWSGGNTSLDAFAAGAPVVALPGRFMRGRQTAAMLRMMGLEALVAADADDYVRLALEVAGDADRRHGFASAIRRERAALFDQGAAVHALSEALLRAAAAPT